MHRKRTTAPDGIRDVMGPPNGRPVKGAGPPQRRITPGRAARVAVELARERRQLEHVPTLAQLEAMARLGGSRPCSYRLEGQLAARVAARRLPARGQRAVLHPGGEIVVLPGGAGFALA
jgi:hypothetical protein